MLSSTSGDAVTVLGHSWGPAFRSATCATRREAGIKGIEAGSAY
jgi:hypothetical protein